VNKGKTSAEQHPFWHSLHLEIPFEVTRAPGMFSTTKFRYGKALAVNPINMSNGSTFSYGLNWLLLLHFRGQLGPVRETGYKDLQISKLQVPSKRRKKENESPAGIQYGEHTDGRRSADFMTFIV
jgi:hypothetical protein